MSAPGLTSRLKAVRQECETVAMLAWELGQGAEDSIQRGEVLDRDTAAFLLASIQSSLSRTRGLIRSYFDLLESEEEATHGTIPKAVVCRFPANESTE